MKRPSKKLIDTIIGKSFPSGVTVRILDTPKIARAGEAAAAAALAAGVTDIVQLADIISTAVRLKAIELRTDGL